MNLPRLGILEGLAARDAIPIFQTGIEYPRRHEPPHGRVVGMNAGIGRGKDDLGSMLANESRNGQARGDRVGDEAVLLVEDDSVRAEDLCGV